MATVTELRNEAAEALAKARTIVDTGGTQAAYENAMEDFHTKRKRAENAAAIAEAEASFGVSQKVVNEMANDLRSSGDAEIIRPVSADIANRNPNGYTEIAPGVIVPFATKDCEGWMKGRAVAVQHPDILKRLSPELRTAKSLQEEAFAFYFRRGINAMKARRPDLVPHLGALNALQEDTDSEGGYLVPTDQRFEVIRNPGNRGGRLRPRSTVMNTTRDGGTWPTATSVTWVGISEESSNSDSDPAFGQVPFSIHKSGANNTLSEELLADSAVNIPALLGQLYGEAVGRYEDQQGIEGDGTTEPLGLRATAAYGTISDITDVWADPPTAIEVTKAYFELPEQWRDGAAWWMTSGLFSKIFSLNSTGAGIHAAESLIAAPITQLLGKDVFFFDGTGWDDAATIGSGEELGAFGNFSTYWFIDRMGMSVSRDDSRYTEKDQVFFKARKRYDSRWSIADAFRILKA